MAYASLLSVDAQTALEKANYQEDRVNIPNNEAICSLCPNMMSVAAALGVDLTAAETTFQVKRDAKGIHIYSPYVAARNGVPVLVWGKVVKPVSEIPDFAIISEGEGEKERTYATIEVDFEVYKFSLMLVKDLKVDAKTLKKAYKQGNLADYLSKGFEKSVKLNTVPAGDYRVTAYRENAFKGEINYDIMVDSVGWVKANAKIKRKLANHVDITEQEPASLTVHPWDGAKTSTGYDIITVDFMTAKDEALPTFSF